MSPLLQALRAAAPRTPDWTERALCAQTDPELFFPGKNGRASSAKGVCRLCDVQPQCLAEALADPDLHGVWGGLTKHERRKLRNRNRPDK